MALSLLKRLRATTFTKYAMRVHGNVLLLICCESLNYRNRSDLE